MSTICYESRHVSIADYHTIKTWFISDVVPVKKRGLSGYHIEACRWCGEMTYTAVLDCWWFIDTCKGFDTIREASNYIRRYAYNKAVTA